MNEGTDSVIAAVEAAVKAALAATGKSSILTLIALAHAYEAWREACLRDARTGEVDLTLAPAVAQVESLMVDLRATYKLAAEAERIDGAVARELDVFEEVTQVLRFTPRGEKGAA